MVLLTSPFVFYFFAPGVFLTARFAYSVLADRPRRVRQSVALFLTVTCMRAGVKQWKGLALVILTSDLHDKENEEIAHAKRLK